MRCWPASRGHCLLLVFENDIAHINPKVLAGPASAACGAVAKRAVPQTAVQALVAVALLAGLQWGLVHAAGAAAAFSVGLARFFGAVAARVRRRSAEGDAPTKGVRRAW